MTLNSEISQAVYSATSLLLGKDEDNQYDVIITGILTYSMVENIYNSGTLTDSINTLSEKYAETYYSGVRTVRSEYVVYNFMVKYLKNAGVNSFLAVNREILNTICKMYENRTMMKNFDVRNFDITMYNILDIEDKFKQRLSKIHHKIMAPIANYYIKKYGISASNIVIEDALIVEDNPGKIIKFRINGINSSKIASQINIGTIAGVKKYLYDVHIGDGSVYITVN